MSNSVTCHVTHRPETLNAVRDRRYARSSHQWPQCPSAGSSVERTFEEIHGRPRLGRRRAWWETRPTGRAPGDSIPGGPHGRRLDRSSGLNIHSDAIGEAYIGERRSSHAFRGGHPQSALNGDTVD
jgi:hypothetical protein